MLAAMNVAADQFVAMVLVERHDFRTGLGHTTDASNKDAGVKKVLVAGAVVVEEVLVDGAMVPQVELQSGPAKLSKGAA